jgi:uncharacterized membrane protein YqjE
MAANSLQETEAAPTGAESESVGTLIKGIVKDLETLAQQHVRLLKADIQQDFKKLRQGAFSAGIGLGIVLIGGLLLGVALAELLLMAFPDPDAYRWAAYGIIGILITGTGVGLLYMGKEEVKEAAPIAGQTMEALEEDVQWLKHPK